MRRGHRSSGRRAKDLPPPPQGPALYAKRNPQADGSESLGRVLREQAWAPLLGGSMLLCPACFCPVVVTAGEDSKEAHVRFHVALVELAEAVSR